MKTGKIIQQEDIQDILELTKISNIFDSLSFISNTSISGLPFKVESVSELDQKPSNSIFSPSLDFIKTFSAIKAERGL